LTRPPLRFNRAVSAAFRLLPLVLVLGSSPPLRAEAVEFTLPAQEADRALMALCRQANIELLFSFDELHQVRSAAVAGRMEPQEALRQLLAGTGFVAARGPNGRFVVTPAEPFGSIRGELRAPAGAAIADARVLIPALRLSAPVHPDGSFRFPKLPVGAYSLTVAASGFQPEEIADARVAAGRELTLDAVTLRVVQDPAQLAPYVVRAKSARVGPLLDVETVATPRSAIGDLDQPRSENDALDYTVFTRDEIARSGLVNLNDFLQREILDSDAVTLPPERNGSVASFASGSSNLNLRGYGTDATIVLVDGRRLPEIVTALPASLTGPTAPQTDVNVIPLNLIERVEVLPVSASAIYSGSPIGGVINIVLRPDVNSTELTTTYTNALAGYDAPQSTTSLLTGQSLLGGRLRLRLNLSYTSITPPTEEELGYIRASLAAQPQPESSLYRATPNIRSANGAPLFGPGTSSITSVAPGADGSGGLGAFAGREGVESLGLFLPAGGGLTDNPNSLDYPYGRQERNGSVYGSVVYDMTPWLQVGFDASAGRSVNHTGYSVFSQALDLPAAAATNPFHQDVEVNVNETAPALGEDYDEAHVDFDSAVLGLLVKLPNNWQASVDAQYGLSVTNYRGIAGVDTAAWQQLVDAGIYNPLRDTQAFGPPPQFYDHVLEFYGSRGAFVTLGDYDTFDSSVRVTNASLPLPTGTATVNVGGDYRYARLASYVDDLRYGDGTLVAPPDTWVGRSLQRISGFGELQAPLLPERWLPSWIHAINIDVAARYTASDLANEANTAPTGAIKIDFAGGLSLRATYATSNTFPPPFFSSLQSAGISTTGTGVVVPVTLNDPLRGGQQENVLVADATNPNLVPEAAVTQTTGFIYQTGAVNHFRAAVDFINTVTSGEEAYLNYTSVLDLESIFPQRVIRAKPVPGDPYAVGPIQEILTGNFNLAWRHSYEWTASLDYEWTECLGGALDVYGRWIYFQRYDIEELPTTKPVDELRAPDGSAPGLLRQRANFGAEWSNKFYGFGVDGQFFPARVLPQAEWSQQGSTQVDPYWQLDSYVQADLGHWLPWSHPHYGLRGQLRVDNVFNAGPPHYAEDPSDAGVQSYTDWRGRVYSVSLTFSF
jgi:iron complex outermembrane recepter protein